MPKPKAPWPGRDDIRRAFYRTIRRALRLAARQTVAGVYQWL